jgi:hypothetical protein
VWKWKNPGMETFERIMSNQPAQPSGQGKPGHSARRESGRWSAELVCAVLASHRAMQSQKQVSMKISEIYVTSPLSP